MNLKRYNALQQVELQRVKDEIKWYLGQELKRDPYFNEKDMSLVEERLAEIVLTGFGKYLASLNESVEKNEIVEKNESVERAKSICSGSRSS